MLADKIRDLRNRYAMRDEWPHSLQSLAGVATQARDDKDQEDHWIWTERQRAVLNSFAVAAVEEIEERDDLKRDIDDSAFPTTQRAEEEEEGESG